MKMQRNFKTVHSLSSFSTDLKSILIFGMYSQLIFESHLLFIVDESDNLTVLLLSPFRKH